MSFLGSLKTVWSDPQMRKATIGNLAIATVASGAVGYAVTRCVTKKWRKECEAYLAEPEITTVDGELYRRFPDGHLQPYFPNRNLARNSNRNSPKKRIKQTQHCIHPQMSPNADVININGRLYRMDRYGNYTPIKMIR